MDEIAIQNCNDGSCLSAGVRELITKTNTLNFISHFVYPIIIGAAIFFVLTYLRKNKKIKLPKKLTIIISLVITLILIMFSGAIFPTYIGY